ncbi:MOSC domain-containing protein [Aliirhizobium smilacinae]|uniref:MOSC domain-containing protein n=1 Tax=Aliirhizobium smilacinae TaxID=1395944 RepID=A0A5C4XV58_9HYPH|nr:MOSC domain-containing protein [Rhizobium smilacinae]TNM66564.1 MOSC domain-containing protein [Rhizobium smilacinae]
MKLLAICTGHAEKLPGKSYKTGINKAVVNAAVMVDALGLVGDAVCNKKHHGGPDQAVLLEGSLTLDWWSAELGRDMPFGTFGENLVIENLDNRDVAVGDRFHIGEIVLEATSPRSPCNTLAARMGDPGFSRAFLTAGRPGIYCRIIRPGTLHPADVVEHKLHIGERVPVADLLASIGRRISDAERTRFLSVPIGSRWREKL